MRVTPIVVGQLLERHLRSDGRIKQIFLILASLLPLMDLFLGHIHSYTPYSDLPQVLTLIFF